MVRRVEASALLESPRRLALAVQSDAERWCRRRRARTEQDRTRALWVWGGLDVRSGRGGSVCRVQEQRSRVANRAELGRAELSRTGLPVCLSVVPFCALCSGWERSRAIGMAGWRQKRHPE